MSRLPVTPEEIESAGEETEENARSSSSSMKLALVDSKTGPASIWRELFSSASFVEDLAFSSPALLVL